VLAGYIAARQRMLPLEAIAGLNGFVLFFALPCMLYRFGATTPIAQLLDAGVFFTWLLCALVIVAFTVTISLNARIGWNDGAFGALVAAFPNTGFMGVPLLVALLGPRAAGPIIVTIMVDMVITTSLCIALSRLDSADEHGVAHAAQNALKGMLVNPLPWSILLGALASFFTFELPGPVLKTVGLLADAASPVALFTIGAVLARSQMRAALHDHPAVPLIDYLPGGGHQAAAAPLAGAAGGRDGDCAWGAAGPVCAHGDGADRGAAQRQQCVAAGRALWRGQRAHRAHHPGVHGSGLPHVFRRGFSAHLTGRAGTARGVALTKMDLCIGFAYCIDSIN
jgi:hypothetical protein